MESVLCRIWTRVAVSISYDNNDYTTIIIIIIISSSSSIIIIHSNRVIHSKCSLVSYSGDSLGGGLTLKTDTVGLFFFLAPADWAV